MECFFVEQKEAMRGNKAAVKHTLTASPPLPPINRGCSINPPVIKKSRWGARDAHRWGGLGGSGPEQTQQTDGWTDAAATDWDNLPPFLTPPTLPDCQEMLF